MTKLVFPCSGPNCKNTVERSPSDVSQSKTKKFFCCKECQHESRVISGKFRRYNASGELVRPDWTAANIRKGIVKIHA